MEHLTNEQRGQLFKHILEYVNDRNPKPFDDVLLKVAFEPIKHQLKRDLNNWEGKIQAKSDSGRLGNIKRWHPDLFIRIESGQITLEKAESIAKDRKASQTSQSIAVTVTDNVNVNDSESDINKPITLGLTNDNFFLVIPKQLGSTKYRVNGRDGLIQFFESHSSVIPLYSDDLAYKFVRNNKGKVFNEFSHVYNSWNKFLEKQ